MPLELSKKPTEENILLDSNKFINFIEEIFNLRSFLQ